VRVGDVTRKNTVKPQGELKAQIDAHDAQIAEAARLGRNGELRLEQIYAPAIQLERPVSAPDTLDQIRHIPQIIVHGDADPTVPVAGSSQHGREAEGARHRAHLHRGARRAARRRRRAEPRGDRGVFRRASEDARGARDSLNPGAWTPWTIIDNP